MDYPEPYKEDYFNSLPHTEVDFSATSQLSPAFDFNSLPHTEVDVLQHFSGRGIHISTHYLTQRQTSEKHLCTTLSLFQLTTSHRGRRFPFARISFNILFQLTTSHRGRLPFTRSPTQLTVFQLTTSHRGRRMVNLTEHDLSIFQLTTSHRGRQIVVFLSGDVFISTHYLTQRQTYIAEKQSLIEKHFNSLPHTEVDNVLIGSSYHIKYFNSLPHTEVDVETTYSLEDVEKHFNSLPHTEVDVNERVPVFR